MVMWWCMCAHMRAHARTSCGRAIQSRRMPVLRQGARVRVGASRHVNKRDRQTERERERDECVCVQNGPVTPADGATSVHIYVMCSRDTSTQTHTPVCHTPTHMCVTHTHNHVMPVRELWSPWVQAGAAAGFFSSLTARESGWESVSVACKRVCA